MQKNVALYQFRNGIPLTTAAAANFTRGELATALRKVLLIASRVLVLWLNDEFGPVLFCCAILGF